MGDRLAEDNVDLGGVEYVKEGEDLLVELKSASAVQSVGQNADPDGGISVVPLTVRDDLDSCDGGVRSVNISPSSTSLSSSFSSATVSSPSSDSISRSWSLLSQVKRTKSTEETLMPCLTRDSATLKRT